MGHRTARLALMNAPFEPDGWARAIEAVAESTRSDTAQMVGLGGPLLMPLSLIVGRDADRVSALTTVPEIWGPANWRLRCAGPPMSIQHEPDYEAARANGGTSIYDDAVADLDMRFGCQATLMVDDRNFLGLAMLRGRRAGPCDDGTLKRFRYLVRLVQRAVRVQLALDGEAAELMAGEMASLGSRLFLIDRHGCLSAMTLAAEPLLEHGPAKLDGLSFGLSDVLENRQLHLAMARLLGGDDPSIPQVHVMATGRTSEYPAGRWRLSLVRLPANPQGLGFDARLAVNFEPMQSGHLATWTKWRKARSSRVERVSNLTGGRADG